LISFNGFYGCRDIAVMFSHRAGRPTGATFDISTPEIEAQNVIVAVTRLGRTRARSLASHDWASLPEEGLVVVMASLSAADGFLDDLL
jgi:hypothetical protein